MLNNDYLVCLLFIWKNVHDCSFFLFPLSQKVTFFFFLQYIPTWSFSSLPSTNWLWLLPHTLPNKSHLSYDSWILLDFLFPMKLEGTLLTFPSFIVNWVSLVPTHTLLPPLIWLSLGFDLVLPLHGMALCLYFCATNRVSFFFFNKSCFFMNYSYHL